MTEIKFEDFLIEKKTQVGNRKILPYSITNQGLYPRDEKYSSDLSDDYSRNKVIKKGNLAFGNSRNILNYGVMRDSIGCVSNVYKVFEVDNNIVSSNYIDLYFKFNRHNLKHLIKPGSRDNLPIDVDLLLNECLKIPSLMIQDYVLNISETINLLIIQRNEINSNLEELAQTLYKRWFVDFEFPNEEGKPYKSSGGEMVESELGLIPKGWEVKLVADLFEFKGGSQPPKSEHIYEMKEGYVRFIQNRDYNDNSNHLTYIKTSKKNKTADKFDILMDKYGEVGKVRFGLVGAYNVALAKIDSINKIDLEYLRGYFTQKSIRTYLENSSIASTRGSLNASTFSGLKVSYPMNSVREKYAEIISNFLHQILNLKSENKYLSELRDLLLPKLMSGEIEV